MISKLIITVPTFGVIWTLKDSNENGVNSAANKDQTNINITNHDGIIPYYEICHLISNNGWTLKRVEYEGPYAYKDKQWISFNDKIDGTTKSKYVKDYPLSGIMIDVSYDDFRGRCGEKYPILKAINEVLYPNIPVEKPNVLLIVIVIAVVLIFLILILAIAVAILIKKKSRKVVNEIEDFSEPKYAETFYDNDYNVYSRVNNEMYADVGLPVEKRYHNFEKQDFRLEEATDGYMEMKKV